MYLTLYNDSDILNNKKKGRREGKSPHICSKHILSEIQTVNSAIINLL